MNSCANNSEENTTSPLPPAKPAATQSTPPPASTTMAVNPAHGQPGHRCDIAVGAPLNSAPTTPANPAPAKPAPTVMPSPAPSAANGSLNPAHGQPGHRCDIAVGAPLPK